MGQFTTTYGGISPRVGIKSIARLLEVGQPLLVTQRFAQVDNMPSRSGNTVKWRRYHAFAISTAPLAEGVPPSVQPLVKTDYPAVLQQYGAAVELTDVCVDLHPDNPLQVAVERCGEQMAQTIETVTIDRLKAGTTVFFAGGLVSTRETVNAVPSRGDFRRISRYFDRNDGQPLTKIVGPTAMVSTQGIEPAFIAMAHTDLESDFRNATGFVDWVKYGQPSARLPGEIGSIERFRVCLTRMFTPWLAQGASSSTLLTNGSSGTGACDVYPVICLARDAYGVVRLQGVKAAEIKVRQPNQTPTDTDPLAQKGSVGWKTYYACAILNEDWIARLECGATANPV